MQTEHDWEVRLAAPGTREATPHHHLVLFGRDDPRPLPGRPKQDLYQREQTCCDVCARLNAVR